ncbi:MAG: squalene synthase HpnC [Armatimonadetes bacterium]|jgi:squalene synthase HpnC|nr:squalene synthase HpnC [Armatimonadota bacterium]
MRRGRAPVTGAASGPGWFDPSPLATPPAPLSVAEARRWCERLARAHYENFTVLSWLLPRYLRPHVATLYAYCRCADDLADETGDPAEALRRLDHWERELERCYAGDAEHPVFVALRETIATFAIPSEPFHDLLVAFRQDQRVTRYDTYEALLGYCRYSANPVGRLVLLLCGYRDPERQHLSDCVCTALQLTNFWQDVARDAEKGRIYLPREDRERFGCTEEQIARRHFTPQFGALIRFEVERTWALFQQGALLEHRLDGWARVYVGLLARGGQEVLRAIERQGCDVLTRRPALSRLRKAMLAGGGLLGCLVSRRG